MSSFNSFREMPLCNSIQNTLEEKQYTTPSPIQKAAIPHLLEGMDLLGSAQTGTGKTAAFAIPVLQRMHDNPKRMQSKQIRTLVLTPTRELAVQVAKSFREYGAGLRLWVNLAYGGVSIGPQIRSLQKGTDILVATPGRLLDLRRQKKVDFSSVEFFILDEADRMLDMGFIHDIKKIVRELPEQRQSLFFSATFSEPITALSQEILNKPAIVKIAPEVKTAENVDHRLCFIDRNHRIKYLQQLLERQEGEEKQGLTIIFSKTKHGADRLCKQLKQQNFEADVIHGNKSQNARQKALDKFKAGVVKTLVATDVAARGIDVPNISLVVNYDLPNEPEAYIHRIGRTARGGLKGQALSFCSGDDFKELRAIESTLRSRIPVEFEHEFHANGLQQRYQNPVRKSKHKRAKQSNNFKSNRRRFNKRKSR